jgi:hypothetical protein
MLLCVYCRRTDVPLLLDPDFVNPMVAMCEDCYATIAPGVPEPSEGEK